MSHDFTVDGDETDAVDFLIGEHRAVEGLFARFEDLRGSDDLAAEEALVADIVRELRVHAEIEEAVFYPAIRKALAQGEELADEGLSEHQEVKDSLVEIEQMAADEPRFEARVTTLINDVRHHVNEEESGILVKLRLALGELTLRALGEELQAAKRASMSGHDPSVLSELPFPGPEVLEEADTTLTLTPATPIRRGRQAAPKATRGSASVAPPATTTKSSTKKRGSSKAPAKATGTQAPKRVGLVTYRVEPAARGWRVVKQGATRASATSDTKPAAVARGRELARRQSRGRLIVQGKDGRVQEEITYGDRARGGRKSA
jgi:hemerythrin superfamily protein